MFVRRKVNRSGSISVHVVDKSRGGFKVIKTFGTASTAYEADLLEDKARQYIREQTGQLESLFGDPGEDRLNEFIAGLHNAQIQVAGPELIFGALYDRIGYDAINNELFRHLVICRLFNPGSKLRTIDYLQRYLGVGYDVAQIYRFLDKLCVFELDDDGREWPCRQIQNRHQGSGGADILRTHQESDGRKRGSCVLRHDNAIL